MNKKFSTLLCAGLLVSAFTLNAQTPAQAQHIDALTSISGVGAAAVPYFESATPKVSNAKIAPVFFMVYLYH